MSYLWIIALLSALSVAITNGQSAITTQTGDTYVCVLPGYCDNGGGGGGGGYGGGIDPRIVTPGQSNVCPNGQTPCYVQGPNSNCGERLVGPTSTESGPAPAGAHPWQAFISNSSFARYVGSGVLIDNYHVLTAAHKVWGNSNNPGAVTVTMGVTDPTNLSGTQTRTASRITINPRYTNFPTLQNDIAIITVATPFSLSGPNINTLCLPASNTGTESANAFLGQQCIVAGWGETNFGVNNAPTNPMMQVRVSPVTIAQCRAALRPVLPSVDTFLDQRGGEVCAGGQWRMDACTFDGGAPLTCPNAGKSSVLGLVIWGKGCGQRGVPGVYASVPYYRQWINSVIQA